MNHQPLFSIVMPTRNRASLLKTSIPSALAQTFPDFEVVVVDNASQDDTREVVSAFKDARLRYIRSEISRSMPDNWEFAWDQARGKYVCFLCDDDAYLPETLAFLVEHVIPLGHSINSWELATYTYPDWLARSASNRLSIPVHELGVRVHETDKLARDLVGFRVDRLWWPRMNNSCVEKAALDPIRRKLGRLFFPLCPDYSFMTVVYHAFSKVCVVHRPLSISGVTTASIGSSQVALGENKAANDFLKEFGDLRLFAACPTKLPLVPNMIAMTVLNVNQALREQHYGTHEVDWHGCFENMAHALREIGRNAKDFYARQAPRLRADAAQYDAATGISVDTILRFQEVRTPWRHRFTAPFGQLIQKLQFLCRLELWVRYGGELSRSFRKFILGRGVSTAGGRVYVEGNQVGAQSILDMAFQFERHLNEYLEFKRKGPRGLWRKFW